MPRNWPKDFINKIICGDCLDVMKDMPDKCVDLILTDPPYGVGINYGETYEDTEENWYTLMRKFIPEAKRIATMVIMPSCQIKRLDWVYRTFPPDWLICWYKGSTGQAAYIGFNDWEPHLVYGKNNTHMHDYFRASPEPLDYKHPCPKPRAWAEWLISRATEEGNIVLDSFIGSGVVAEACRLLKRDFIGIEINPDYCKIAEERLVQGVL